MKRALFISRNLLGDGLYIGPAAERWYQLHGSEYDELHLLTLGPDHYVIPIYRGMGVPWKIVFEPEGEYDLTIDFDISKAFAISDKKKIHLTQCYAELAGVPGEGLEARPNYKPPEMYVEPELRNFVMVSMFSMSCSSRGTPPGPPNKMLPWAKWRPLLDTLDKEYPESKIKLLGAKEDRVPPNVLGWSGMDVRDCDYLTGVPIDKLANIMRYAKVLVTVDNGMGHLAASQGLNEFLLAPVALQLHYIVPWGHPGVRVVHINPVTVNPANLNWQLKSAIRDWKEKENV